MRNSRKRQWKALIFIVFLSLIFLGPVMTLKADETGQNVEASSGSQMLTDDLYEYSFMLDGVVYKLPCDYKVFADNGWEIQADLSEEINANTYGISRVKNGDKKLSVLIFNPTSDAQKISDCKISSVTVYYNDDVSFELPKGITVKSSLEDIKNAYGTPSQNQKESDYQTLTYKKNENEFHSHVKFVLYNDPSNSYIEVENMIIQEGDKGEASTEVPDYLASYKAPAKLGDDAESPEFELDGKLYRLPCPLTEFTDNGWTVDSKQVDQIDAGNYDLSCLTISKDNFSIQLGMKNYAKVSTIVENCAVYKVDFEREIKKDEDNYKEGFVLLPSGLGLDFTPEILKSKLTSFEAGDNNNVESGSYYSDSDNYNTSIRYSYYNSDAYSNRSVEIQNREWDY